MVVALVQMWQAVEVGGVSAAGERLNGLQAVRQVCGLATTHVRGVFAALVGFIWEASSVTLLSRMWSR